MASGMAKLFREAFQEAGLELPKPEARKPVHIKKPGKPNTAPPPRPAPAERPRPAITRPPRPSNAPKEKPLNTSCYSSGMPGEIQAPAVCKATAKDTDYVLTLLPEAGTRLESDGTLKLGKRILPTFDGRRSMMVESPADAPDLELKIGIDFGTSSTKIVIADKQQDRAFAVPFMDDSGVRRYLLPGIVFKTSHYHLDDHGKALRDLKLNLLPEQVHTEKLVQAAAFLALAIRHARGWLFTEHASLYRKATVAWTLCLGMPSEDPNDPRLKPRFERLSIAAWLAAASDTPLTDQLLEQCLLQAEQFQNGAPGAPAVDLEIRAVPELAAQVHGHVASESFDPRGRNLFMMVDVGAGTVDSCLFHVHRDKKTKRWNFLMYTKAVEENGTVNLHRHRLDWWTRAVTRFHPERTDLLKDIDNARYRSDCLTQIPPRLEDYVSGAELRFDSPEIHPDTAFLKKRLKNQVFFKTYAEARNQRHLQEADLTDMPTFLCGGGMRMPFYQQLRAELDKAAPNASWLRAKRMELSKPRKMLAPGLPPEDYDRLSVAYGLGMMDFGVLEQSMGSPLPPRVTARPSHDEAYINKDMM